MTYVHITPHRRLCRGIDEPHLFGDPGSPGAVPGELSVDARIAVCALTRHRIAAIQVR
jgi:hypothetical protein